MEHKRAASTHRGTDRLSHAAPAALELLKAAAARGHNLGTITAALLRLLERYGATALQAAIGEALQRDVPHPNRCAWRSHARARSGACRRLRRCA